MAISLTSAGLYLEPRVYGGSKGMNYGTPKFVSSSTSLGGGSWTGLFYFTSNWESRLDLNVATSSRGEFTSEYPNSISRKGGGLNADDRCRNRTLLLFNNKLSKLFSSLWSAKYNSRSSKRCQNFSSRLILKCRHFNFNRWFYIYYQGKVHIANKVCLNPYFVKEVA